jgi:WD40 repeat protein
MRRFKIIVVVLLLSFSMVGQEVIKKTNFPSRDFYISQDSIVYIEKRNVKIEGENKKEDYFIGGYGLEIYNSKTSNEIITASNELVKNVSSVRFYNKNTKKVENVFYYKKGKSLDFLIIPELNTFVLSLTNKKIVFINFKNKPSFKRTIEIKLKTLSRKLIYRNNKLYYATDLGEIYQYDMVNNSKELLYKTDSIITDFYLSDSILIYSTIDGKITRINMQTNKKREINLGNNFINIMVEYQQDKLVCGSWKGLIYVIDVFNFAVKKELNYHTRTVLKILNYNDNIFYSSSLDKTIKKWILN